SPPKSVVTTGPEEASPRPISVWLLVLLLLAVDIICATGMTRFLLFIASRFSEVAIGIGLLVAIGWRIAVIAALLVLIAGIMARRQWGRWLGLLAISGLVVYCVLAPDTTVYANSAERAGGFAGRLVFLPLLLGWLAYAFGFSGKSKRYFVRRPSEALSQPHTADPV